MVMVKTIIHAFMLLDPCLAAFLFALAVKISMTEQLLGLA